MEFAEEEAAKKVVEMKDLRFRAAAVEAKEGEVKTESDLAAPGTENGPLLLQWKYVFPYISTHLFLNHVLMLFYVGIEL